MDRKWVSWYEAMDLAKYDILLPPKVTVPKGFGISLGGVPVPPIPKGRQFLEAMSRVREKEALGLDPKYHDDSDYWPARFQQEREAALNRFEGEHPPPENNMDGRIEYWRRPGRTVQNMIENARHVTFIKDATTAGIVNLDSDDEC